jgi:hypothetical protein
MTSRMASQITGVLCTLLVAGTAQAERNDEFFQPLDDAPRFMLYVQKQLGTSPRKSKALSFGVSVERQTPMWSSVHAGSTRTPTVRLLDLRFAPYDDGAVYLNGLQLTGKGPYTLGYEGSYGEEGSWGSPWLWGIGGVALLLGISCATENFPCDDSYDSGDRDYRPPGS